jgi:hypothetical protein
MIRILAASLSVAALIVASLPAAAQQRQFGTGVRGAGQPSFTVKRSSGPKRRVSQRKFRSFNPPSPQISSGRRHHHSFNPPAPGGQAPTAYSRGLAPPSPGVAVAPRSFVPHAPAGGNNFIHGSAPVPASLPAPSPGESSPTAAPEASSPQLTVAAPDQSTQAAPQSDLQAPIPETVTAQSDPAATDVKLVGQPMSEQIIQPVVRGPIVRHVYEVRVVYVPVYKAYPVYRRHRVYAPHHVYHGPRVHFGHRFHRGFRRW